MSSTQTFSGQVAAAIRAEMAWHKFTSNDLAEALEISQRAAARRLNGEVEIGLNELDAIAKWLKVDISELMEIHRPRQVA